MVRDLMGDLEYFQGKNEISSKGQLSAVLQLTDIAKHKPFPFNPKDFLTSGGGQVAKLSGTNCNKILEKHGVNRKLASEAGRTSRGTIKIMESYISFLNGIGAQGDIDFDFIEQYWVNKIIDFFNSQPFVLNMDASKSVSANILGLFEQAKNRQKKNPGTHYLGIMLQHLVAAKLGVILPPDSFEILGASVADEQTDRGGDFVINNTIIHCTTMPGSPLIEKCFRNLQSGCHPVIITIFERVQTAVSLAYDAGLAGRIEVWDIQQFLSANVYEHSLFNEANRNSTLFDIISKYNDIVAKVESDPSLRIKFDLK